MVTSKLEGRDSYELSFGDLSQAAPKLVGNEYDYDSAPFFPFRVRNP